MTDFSFYVNYENGNRIKLLDKVNFDDIPREGLKDIETRVGNGIMFTMHLEKDQKAIFRKRGFVSQLPPEKHPEPVVYLIGWRQKVGGKDIQSITYICDWIGRGFQIHQAGSI